MYTRTVNRSEVVSRPVTNPADPYGPPLIKYMLRVRCYENGRWWYVRSYSNTRETGPCYKFTSDPTYARLMSLRTARSHQGNMSPGILNR